MSKLRFVLVSALLIIFSVSIAQAQNSKQRTNFLLSGFGYTNFEKAQDGISSFNSGFSPIFLWKSGERLFFEGEAEFELEDGATNAGLEYAQMFYSLNNNMQVGVGKFLNPNNLFMERLHPTWINRLPNNPLGVSGHGGVALLATAQLGMQIKGAVPLKSSKFTYALYISNGPAINISEAARDSGAVADGHGESAAAPGTLDFSNYNDNNNNKAFGGRIGLFPLPQLEIGLGFEIANVGGEASPLVDLQAITNVFDLSYTRASSLLKGQFDIRSQFISLTIDKSDEEQLNYKNESSSGYGQIAYRPNKIANRLLKNCEFVFRYDYLDLPEFAYLNSDLQRTTFGLNYWLAPNSAIKFAFENKTIKGHEEETESMFITQFALGF